MGVLVSKKHITGPSILSTTVSISADLALYEADPLFCRDHSRKIAVSQLNDDFCDCPDGSDEPGMALSTPLHL